MATNEPLLSKVLEVTAEQINELPAEIEAVKADIGNVATLTTTAKTAVGAINELHSNIADQLGDNLQAEVVPLDVGEDATVDIDIVDGNYVLKLGIPNSDVTEHANDPQAHAELFDSTVQAITDLTYTINVPAQNGTLTYNGGSQSPSWANYNPTKMTIGGTQSATNTGSYTATFTPKAPYRWMDHTTTSKNVMWSITNAAGGKMLWDGALQMSASDTVTLSETVDKQQNGIVLVFSRYENGVAHNTDFNCFFIPKMQFTLHNGMGHSCFLTNSTLSNIANKYVYIHNDHLTGNAVNVTDSGTTASGITRNNKFYALRHVIGV